MSNLSKDCAISPDFDLSYYVEASHDAAKRTRTVTIILVVACVLISIGWYNTLRWSWALHRIKQAYEFTNDEIYRILDPENPPSRDDPKAKAYLDHLQYATVNEYVENVRFVRVPFFGTAFDVNDLGTIGGLALITVLVLLRYSLSREIKNLNVSFEESVLHGRLCVFYHALAMRQLFTVPHMKGETRNWKLARLPEFVGIIPAIIFSLGVMYDFYSTFGWKIYHFGGKVTFTLVAESVCLVFIWVISLKCLGRKRHINSIWDKYWERMSAENKVHPSVIMLDKDLVEEFGSDEIVNKALRELRDKRSEANTLHSLPAAKERKTSVVILEKELAKEFAGDVTVNTALRELRVKRSEDNKTDVLDKFKDGQKGSRKPQVTADSKRRYTIALLFVGIFIASTTILLGRVSGVFRPTSDTTTGVAVFGAVISTIVALSQLILTWRSDKRDAKVRALDERERA